MLSFETYLYFVLTNLLGLDCSLKIKISINILSYIFKVFIYFLSELTTKLYIFLTASSDGRFNWISNILF
jgi:hypothetical protein